MRGIIIWMSFLTALAVSNALRGAAVGERMRKVSARAKKAREVADKAYEKTEEICKYYAKTYAEVAEVHMYAKRLEGYAAEAKMCANEVRKYAVKEQEGGKKEGKEDGKPVYFRFGTYL